MTKKEYEDYLSRVEKFMQGDLSDTPIEYLSTNGEVYNEFSSHPCECCNRPLAGTRYLAEAIGRENGKLGQIGKYQICQDCVYFAEYGELDDMTMLDVAEDEKQLAKADAEKALWDCRAKGLNVDDMMEEI